MIQLLSVIIIHSSPFDEVAQGPEPPKQEKFQGFSLKGGKTIEVTQILFSGNQAISTKQLEQLVSQYENQMLTELQIEEIQERIELLYKSKGYDNVEVTVPKKQKSGTLEFVIKEGKKSS